jgi:cytochrome b561
LTSYLFRAVISQTKLYASNNPGSAMAALLMFIFAPALLLSGLGVGGESWEELHEVIAWALLVVIGLHLLGLAWHTVRHRENISLAMITGKKAGQPEDTIALGNAVWGAIIVIGTAFHASARAGHYAPR